MNMPYVDGEGTHTINSPLGCLPICWREELCTVFLCPIVREPDKIL